jgi:hypothetical protein
MRDLLRRSGTRTAGLRRWAAPTAAAAILLTGGGAIAQASTSVGRGPNEYGMTMGSYHKHLSTFTYDHGFFCDTNVKASSMTGCEAGAPATRTPSRHFDPLFITVPLGFSAKGLDCPDRLTCVDHPMTLDLTRLAPALAPLYKTTAAKLAPMLKNVPTPGHDHFITDKNSGKAEWWDVRVIGVTDKATYKAIQQHHTMAYIRALLRAKNKRVVGPITTNIFLFFSAR